MFMALLTVIYERQCAAANTNKQSDNNSKYGDPRQRRLPLSVSKSSQINRRIALALV